MTRSWATLRICATLVSVTICAVIAAQMLGLVPDREVAVSSRRIALVDSLAVGCSVAAREDDVKRIKAILQEITNRNQDVISAGLRLTTGELRVDVENHSAHWSSALAGSSIDQMRVPLTRNHHPWATVEVCFATASQQFPWVSSFASVWSLDEY